MKQPTSYDKWIVVNVKTRIHTHTHIHTSHTERLLVQVHPFNYWSVTLFLHFDFSKVPQFYFKNVTLRKNRIFWGHILNWVYGAPEHCSTGKAQNMSFRPSLGPFELFASENSALIARCKILNPGAKTKYHAFLTNQRCFAHALPTCIVYFITQILYNKCCQSTE